MNSPHQREQLPDLLSDALTDTERARVESHLAECEQCARELRALQSMQQSLAALPAATSPDRIRANVRAALRENPEQARNWSSFLANRERSGARRALPFALQTRQLAWGGAVAVAAVGLMLLARPSLQNDSLSASAPVSESELAARADQNAQSADAPKSSAPAPAPGNARTNKNQKAKPNAKSPQTPASAPPRAVQPENLAPIPAVEFPPAETPAIERAPQQTIKPSQTPRASKKPARPLAPPKISQKSESSAQPGGQTEKERDKSAPATVTQPAPSLVRPNGPATSAENSDRARSNDAATAPGASASGSNSARSDEPTDHINQNAPAAPVTADGAFQAAPMPRQSLAKASPAWTGGEVTATVTRVQSLAGRTRLAPETNVPILTLSVSKPIGDARLFLRLPDGETQIWSGVVNAIPVKINLDDPALANANLLGGQKIRARLEQIDGEGNPKGSILFDLLWP